MKVARYVYIFPPSAIRVPTTFEIFTQSELKLSSHGTVNIVFRMSVRNNNFMRSDRESMHFTDFTRENFRDQNMLFNIIYIFHVSCVPLHLSLMCSLPNAMNNICMDEFSLSLM